MADNKAPQRADDRADDRATPGGPVEFAVPEDQEPDLSDMRAVDVIPVAMFWVLAGVVFLQFFTRYVLNDSLGWTEEIARYLLIVSAFTGAVIAVRKDSHIVVEFFYRYLSMRTRKLLSATIDVAKTAFFVAATWYSVELAMRTRQKMASIEVSKAVIYWIVAACFAAMALYAARLAWDRFHGRRHGALTQPPVDPSAGAF
ncbi:TRAP transporter small permease [Rubrimonas cliftonensis]|uniref:TRAP transporter small permease protein n=1 Tax=Rubrimonas cliftonensis TaxID=89524 RepID=A0A1H3VEM4_9RHOB|nr:TRAP transporter small permease [Rubrimonas cliftonensis]SDZ73190.1 TRAP-type C4-dicarboxylate transport system, small permease component [Rubrimonas cliftonensis]